jgi:hypothetical protein
MMAMTVTEDMARFIEALQFYETLYNLRLTQLSQQASESHHQKQYEQAKAFATQAYEFAREHLRHFHVLCSALKRRQYREELPLTLNTHAEIPLGEEHHDYLAILGFNEFKRLTLPSLTRLNSLNPGIAEGYLTCLNNLVELNRLLDCKDEEAQRLEQEAIKIRRLTQRPIVFDIGSSNSDKAMLAKGSRRLS